MSNRFAFPLILGASHLPSIDTDRPLVFTRGDGVFLWDESGQRYLEAASSFYCAALGFSEPELVNAVTEQITRLPFSISAGRRTTLPAIALAERLAELAPFPNARVAFANSGSEANDALIKFTRFANVARGSPHRKKIICRAGSYHGCTSLTASLGSSETLRGSFALSGDDVILVSQPDFSNAAENEDEAAFVERLGQELEHAIETAGSESIAAFLAEPVSFSAGFVIPPMTYFRSVTKILEKHNICFFGDEIVTGFHRLGPLMGWQAFDLRYHAFTLGKALTAAFLPMGAVVLDEELFEAMMVGNRHGVFGHVSTYAGHPVCAAVALRVLDLFEKRKIGAHVATVSPIFRSSIENLKSHAMVADVSCMGLAAALYLQLPPDVPRHGRNVLGSVVQRQALANGLIVRVNGDAVIIAPPLVITTTEIAELANRMRSTLDGAAAVLKRPEAIRPDPTVTHPNRA